MPAPSTAACFGVSTFLVELFGFALHKLIVKEDTNQRAGFVGVRQRDKALVFQLQGVITAQTGCRFNGFSPP
ncbi:hypothetical protein PGS1_12922 [Enterobacter cloacae subsp. cloacae GS1]|nr:hypothetical protein PGS1_12922 [Enterobacter cloacae subsp. cloacae GS1]